MFSIGLSGQESAGRVLSTALYEVDTGAVGFGSVYLGVVE